MFRSRLFIVYLSINLLEIGITWFLWFFNRENLPETVPFNFLAVWGNGQLIPSADLWQLPAIMSVGLGILIVFSFYYWRKEKIYSQYLISTLGFINFIALLSFVRLIIRFS